MITSLIELPNFGHMTTSTTEFDSHDKILMVRLWAKIMTPYHYFKIALF